MIHNRAFRTPRNLSAVAALAALLAGCAVPTVEVASDQECVRNFTKQSGLANYRTTATLDGVTREQATDRLVRALSRKGFVINQNDGSKGYINATFDAGSSDLQLSAFIEQRRGGSHVELNYAGTGAGLGLLATPASAYRSELCQFVDAMRGG